MSTVQEKEFDEAEETAEKFKSVALEIAREACEAREKWGDFSSLHEAYAVLAEEVDELWDEVRKRRFEFGVAPTFKQGVCAVRDSSKIRQEALQIAAIALRIAADSERMAQK